MGAMSPSTRLRNLDALPSRFTPPPSSSFLPVPSSLPPDPANRDKKPPIRGRCSFSSPTSAPLSSLAKPTTPAPFGPHLSHHGFFKEERRWWCRRGQEGSIPCCPQGARRRQPVRHSQAPPGYSPSCSCQLFLPFLDYSRL